MLFSHPDLAPMRQYLSYKNVDKMKILLTELPYSEETWWTKSLNIRLLIADVVSKNILCTI